MFSLSQLIDEEFHDYVDVNKSSEKKSKSFCSNCGKYGHISKKCKEPIISIGIINMCLNNDALFHSFENKYVMKNVLQNYTRDGYQIKNIILQKFNEKNNGQLQRLSDIEPYVNIVKNSIKFLMIRRKYSVGYIEFVKGRYNEKNDEEIIYIINQITPQELLYLKTHTFDEIWQNMWDGKYNNIPLDETATSTCEDFNILSSKDQYIYTKIHLKEYISSKNKYEYMHANNVFDRLESDHKIHMKYDEPEWGFPKGRRNLYEKNQDCAIREFFEETGMDMNDVTVMDRIYPINELLTGTNNLEYKHSYYLSLSKMETDVSLNLHSQKIEIGAIGWFTYKEVQNMIRSYHINRLRILEDLILFIAHNIKYYSSLSLQ